jgi:hypothetical protein
VDRCAAKQAALAKPEKTIILLALAEPFDSAKAKGKLLSRNLAKALFDWLFCPPAKASGNLLKSNVNRT